MILRLIGLSWPSFGHDNWAVLRVEGLIEVGICPWKKKMLMAAHYSKKTQVRI